MFCVNTFPDNNYRFMEPIIIVITNDKPVTTNREKLVIYRHVPRDPLPCNSAIIYGRGHLKFTLNIVLQFLVRFRFRRLFSEEPGRTQNNVAKSFS